MGERITRIGQTLIVTPKTPPKCGTCGTEGISVSGRRRGDSSYWHCWKCDRPIRGAKS